MSKHRPSGSNDSRAARQAEDADAMQRFRAHSTRLMGDAKEAGDIEFGGEVLFESKARPGPAAQHWRSQVSVAAKVPCPLCSGHECCRQSACPRVGCRLEAGRAGACCSGGAGALLSRLGLLRRVRCATAAGVLVA